MRNYTLDLKEEYPFLKKDSCRGFLTCYLLDNSGELEMERKHPAVIVLPGGAYVGTSFRESEPFGMPFLGHGYQVFVLHYSGLPSHYPAALQEVAAAIHYIRTHAEEFYVDPDAVVVMGGSAGGHLAASISTMWKEPFLGEALHCDGSFLRPNAQIIGYGLITAREGCTHMSSFHNLTGHTDLTEEETAFFSMENHVAEDTPPCFLWHTAADEAVPVANALIYAQALSDHKVPFELHVYPHGRHGQVLATYVTAPKYNREFIYPDVATWVDHALSWLTDLFHLEH